MPVSKRLEPLIFATLPSIGSLQSMGKVIKIRVASMSPKLGHSYPKVTEVP